MVWRPKVPVAARDRSREDKHAPGAPLSVQQEAAGGGSSGGVLRNDGDQHDEGGWQPLNINPVSQGSPYITPVMEKCRVQSRGCGFWVQDLDVMATYLLFYKRG